MSDAFEDLEIPPPELPMAAPAAVVVPPERLSDDVLWDLAREALLRQRGNDDAEADLESATRALVRSVRAGRHVVTFDPSTESVGIT